MSNLRRILVIMDKTKHAQTALRHGLDLQTRTGAHLHLVAFCWHPMYGQTDIFEPHQRRAIKLEILRVRREWLQTQVRENNALASDITTEVVWTDQIASWTVQKVTTEKFDLVVKSVHPSQSFIHTPLDWQLLRENPVATLLATEKRRKPSGNILAALDLRHDDRAHRSLNEKVLAAANEFATAFKGRMHCVYVVEYSKILSDLDIIDVRKVKAQAKANSDELLKALLEPYPTPTSRIHCPAGKVGMSVANVAKKINADLLVMGTRAYRRNEGLLLGNSAERVLARTPCDVLTVRP